MKIDPLPTFAERFDFSVAIKTIKRPSRFLPGLEAFADQLVCPKCKIECDTPPDYQTYECGCGLRMQVRTLNLYVWPKIEVVT